MGFSYSFFQNDTHVSLWTTGAEGLIHASMAKNENSVPPLSLESLCISVLGDFIVHMSGIVLPSLTPVEPVAIVSPINL